MKIGILQTGQAPETIRGALRYVADNTAGVNRDDYWPADLRDGIEAMNARIYPAINNGVFRDLYVVIGDPQADGGWAVRTYIKPFANWIWAGCIIMAFGGLLSLSDRRYRVAAGARRTAPPAVQPAE